jgi:hypothetical protein
MKFTTIKIGSLVYEDTILPFLEPRPERLCAGQNFREGICLAD